ncbi:hypothetical protein [Cellulosimicrobium sp. Marseille-Q8652]
MTGAPIIDTAIAGAAVAVIVVVLARQRRAVRGDRQRRNPGAR